MASLTTSAAGITALIGEEGAVDGLYDDPSGYCTFGVGHLVHPTNKWSGFLLAAATANDAWKAQLGSVGAWRYVPRGATGWSDFSDLTAQAVTRGADRVGQAAAQAAVQREADLLGQKVADVLAVDLGGQYEEAVNGAVTGVALTQDEFDALVSLCFNIGTGGFRTSTAVRLINQNQYRSGSDAAARQAAITGIENAFAMWNKSGGRVAPALAARRKRESDRFLRGAREELARMGVAVPAQP